MEKDIRAEFEDYIRNKLTDNEFWVWVRSWYDVEHIIDIATDWDIDLMKEDLKKWKKKGSSI